MSVENLQAVVVILERLRIGLRPFVEDIFNKEFPGFTKENLKDVLRTKPAEYWVPLPNTFRGMDLSDLLWLITDTRRDHPWTLGKGSCMDVVRQKFGAVASRRFFDNAKTLRDFRTRVAHHDDIKNQLNDYAVRQAMITALLLLAAIAESYDEAAEQLANLDAMQQDLPRMGVVRPDAVPDTDSIPDTLSDYMTSSSKMGSELDEIIFKSGSREDYEARTEAGLRGFSTLC